jgi:CO/xanthine dehydrogenase Mo-binding subunit
MSIGNALYANTVKNGSVEQSNYTDYLVPRIDITPETNVYFVENTHLPGGVGEPGVPTAPRSATRSTPPPANGSGHCRSIRSC